jgi:hypothetical protein
MRHCGAGVQVTVQEQPQAFRRVKPTMRADRQRSAHVAAGNFTALAKNPAILRSAACRVRSVGAS